MQRPVWKSQQTGRFWGLLGAGAASCFPPFLRRCLFFFFPFCCRRELFDRWEDQREELEPREEERELFKVEREDDRKLPEREERREEERSLLRPRLESFFECPWCLPRFLEESRESRDLPDFRELCPEEPFEREGRFLSCDPFLRERSV